MARNEQAEAVGWAERARGSRGTGSAGQRGELPVGDDLAARDLPQGAGAAVEERRLVFEVELDLVERGVLAREVSLEQLDEPVRPRGRRLARPGQLVPDDPPCLVEPELPHAPAIGLVGQMRHRHDAHPRRARRNSGWAARRRWARATRTVPPNPPRIALRAPTEPSPSRS